MLAIYVVVIILVQNLSLKELIDGETAKVLVYSLDVPTMLVLVVYAGLSFKQELAKPKYKIPKKNRWMIDAVLSCIGIIIFGTLLIIKYLI